ncbi:hypothetical protein [Halobacillus seohaensis]|uniref:Uncharacterized protein n=1 Tax=Halobacillus seohaensis TaxID=447421 RepID=A0ABW2EN54_9BACI
MENYTQHAGMYIGESESKESKQPQVHSIFIFDIEETPLGAISNAPKGVPFWITTIAN